MPANAPDYFDNMSAYELEDSPPAYYDAVHTHPSVKPNEKTTVRSILKTIVFGPGTMHPGLVRARIIEHRLHIAALADEARRAEAKAAKKAKKEAAVAQKRKVQPKRNA